MFCNQCEQASKGVGCTEAGVCGKDEDVQSLQETLLFGIKGLAAYAHHARRLGRVDASIDAFVEEGLFATLTNVNFDVPALLELVLECGRKNFKAMEMIDEAHVERFGAPSPTKVAIATRPQPGILVTGHDFLDLQHILEQVEGTDVRVYTHGEMLPAHMYPRLREHPNLAGHFGGAWHEQKSEFEAFGGAIVATTNCVLPPRPSYANRLFTTRVAAVPGATRLRSDDFGQVVEAARRAGPLKAHLGETVTVGFHHSVLLAAAPTIVDAVKKGQVRHFYLIGGCEGPEVGRSWYSDFAKDTPKDSFILTLGCGKYRIMGHDHGTLLGLPRLLDMGQCNDAYGAIKVAVALAEAFGCSVNELPLTIVLSWLEQKAVAVLLTLLALGVKGIRIGPAAPAFVTPNVLKVLQSEFDLRLVGNTKPVARA